MEKLRFTYLALFIIFFGIALIEALEKPNWLGTLSFSALGLLFLWMHFRKK